MFQSIATLRIDMFQSIAILRIDMFQSIATLRIYMFQNISTAAITSQFSGLSPLPIPYPFINLLHPPSQIKL